MFQSILPSLVTVNTPRLIVVAGCNGSGKSTFSRSLTQGALVPFDYDKVFLDIYNSKPDSELKELMSHNEAFRSFEDEINDALRLKKDFCYETNFHSDPMHWPDIFKAKGYQLEMFFFCLDSMDEAKRRVLIRFENGGHFVPNDQVEQRFVFGYKCLEKYFAQFDTLHLLDSSAYNNRPAHILTAHSGKVVYWRNYPQYLVSRLPALSGLVKFKRFNS